MRSLVLLSLLALAFAPLAAPPAAACHPQDPETGPGHHGCGGNMDPAPCLYAISPDAAFVKCLLP